VRAPGSSALPDIVVFRERNAGAYLGCGGLALLWALLMAGFAWLSASAQWTSGAAGPAAGRAWRPYTHSTRWRPVLGRSGGRPPIEARLAAKARVPDMR
jgi:hypothetical protein